MALCCILADAAARLCVGTCWRRPRTQGCGCYTAPTNTSPSCYSVQKEKKTTVCCNMTSTDLSGKLSVHQHPRLVCCALLLRKSIAINLQPTLLCPDAPNVQQQADVVFSPRQGGETDSSHSIDALLLSGQHRVNRNHQRSKAMSLSSSRYRARPLTRDHLIMNPHI